MWRREAALFGRESPRQGLKASVLLAEPVDACSPETTFRGARRETGWIALLRRGNGCTFTEKINRAAENGAAAAVIYNEDGTENTVTQMAHPEGWCDITQLLKRPASLGNLPPDTTTLSAQRSNFVSEWKPSPQEELEFQPSVRRTSIVAVMMGNIGGTMLAHLLSKGIPVTMEIEVGRVFEPLMSHYSIFLISVSFIIITTATVAYFIYYTARRLYRAGVQNRKQNQLKAKAKKAMSQLQIRTLKNGDQECVGPDPDSCAVCIEVYKPGDVLSVLTCRYPSYSHTLPHSLTHSLPHSLPPSLSHSLSHTLPPSLSHSLTHFLPPPLLTQSHTSSLPHSLTPSLPQSHTSSLPPYSLSHTLPPSLSHSLTHFLHPPLLTQSH
ncbi:hypothetical protein NFI96_032267, partial [Prochilodus magdalenae]